MKKGISFFFIGILVTTVIVTSTTVIYFYEIYGKGGKAFSRIGNIPENISNVTFGKEEHLYLNYMENCTIKENETIVCTNISKFNPPKKGYWEGCFIVFENETEEIININKIVHYLHFFCFPSLCPFPWSRHERRCCIEIVIPMKCNFRNNTYYWNIISTEED